jgi:hypothetical protein
MISYCTNVHPGETWEETLRSLDNYVCPVKDAVSPDEAFPIGLRLSARAASEIDRTEAERFLGWLDRNSCFVPTINGFPYGSFHSEGLKRNVYLPDWTSPDRLSYTKNLADLLSLWLPRGVKGSISTVPVGFRSMIGEGDIDTVKRNFLSMIEHLDRILQRTGKEIVLALEPEPCCFLETTDDVVSFFHRMAFPDGLRSFIGVCFDCCHQAVEFEEPAAALASLRAAQIGIGKVHVSSALCFAGSERGRIAVFDEPSYLHQTIVRDRDGLISRYADIPDALGRHPFKESEEWRVHFHVPIYAEKTRYGGTTQSFIEEAMPFFPNEALLEIETYTWQVLPDGLVAETLIESIVREIRWLRDTQREGGRRS